ncbi:TPA: hypothetical protein U1578_001390 [Streptococcus suis]|uniref:hypothetical protein n=1 Tax=Streptococcus suis TaxID=1307 RepID=UPI000942A7FF|nr:hypothetical protein [Streptococcus suis]NQN94018.1 hypothetical protein [Streptococcus suis]NQO06205.1 hypothetical protein [Streptococcus suis]NQO36648.1 hypothetical protein [Streptococcus suis]HEM5432346.1 hypothetical protein [Streptococcus suis]
MTKKTATKTRRDFLEFELEGKYLKIDKLIGQRRHELERLYAVKNLTIPGIDDSGASRSGTSCNKSENLAIAYASDPLILKLEEFQKAIVELLATLEPDDRKIFHLRWGEQTGYDWIQIWHIMQNGETGYLYNHSKQIYRRREVILDTLAKLLYM